MLSLSDKTERPATVILGVKVEKDGTLSATTQDGTVIGTMKEAVKSLDKKMIPAFRFETEAEGKAIAAFTGENRACDPLFYYIGLLGENLGDDELVYIKRKRRIIEKLAKDISAVESKRDTYKMLREAMDGIDRVLGNK